MVMGFNKRLSIFLPLACSVLFACAQPQVSAVSEPQAAFEWEDPSQFSKYCIWRELAPVDGAACWELIVFNHTRETLVVPLRAEQPAYVMRELLPLSEMTRQRPSGLKDGQVLLVDGTWCLRTQLTSDAYLVPPNYTQRFRVRFPISASWAYAEFNFGGAESDRQFVVQGPVIAPGPAKSAAPVRIDVESASWKLGAPDFLMTLDRLDASWSAGETWAIEHPTPKGWDSTIQGDGELPLRPNTLGFGLAESVSVGERLPVVLHWALRCFPVRATARIAAQGGTVRSRAIYLPRYPCDSASCPICQREAP